MANTTPASVSVETLPVSRHVKLLAAHIVATSRLSATLVPEITKHIVEMSTFAP